MRVRAGEQRHDGEMRQNGIVAAPVRGDMFIDAR